MLDHFPELDTERLHLIEITQFHLNDFYKLFSDERVARYGNCPHDHVFFIARRLRWRNLNSF